MENGANGRSRAHLDSFSNCPPLINVPLAGATGEPGTRPARNETPRAVRPRWRGRGSAHRPIALVLNSLGARKGGLVASASGGVREGPPVEVLRPCEARRGSERQGEKEKGKAY